MLKVRIKFRKYGIMRFIGHLDVMRYFQKAMRRAGIPIAFTGGYSPHMIMSFAQPLGIGLTSDGEYVDIELTDSIPSQTAVSALNAVMTEGIQITSFRKISEEKRHSGMTIVAAADYLVSPKDDFPVQDLWAERFPAFLESPSIFVLKKTKRSEKELDIRPLILESHLEKEGLFLKLAAGSSQNLKPDLVMEAFYRQLGIPCPPLHYHRLDLYAKSEEASGCYVTLEQLGEEIF